MGGALVARPLGIWLNGNAPMSDFNLINIVKIKLGVIMKKVIATILFASVLLPILILVSSCSSASTDVIFKPEMNYRSPALDFSKVQAAAIMPVNCYTNEVTELSGLINDGLPAELKRVQTAWKIISYDDVLRKLNDAGLGRGYQNYIADLNTYSTVAGMTPNFTSETQNFFDQLKKEMNFEAILFTSYGFSEKTVMETSFVGAMFGSPNQPVIKKVLSVSVVLYDLSSKRTWWVAKLSLQSNMDMPNAELARKVIEGIANNFGKGDLRQL